MPSHWLHILAVVYQSVSAVLISADILNGHKQRMAVMNVVWPMTALYFGPFGVWTYRQLG